MDKEQHQITKRWRLIIVLSAVFLLLMVVQDVIREVIVFNREIAAMEENLLRNVENDVKNLVVNVANEYKYKINNMDDRMVDHATENIAGLSVATQLLIDSQSVLDDTELTELTVDLMESYNMDDPNHLYLMYDSNGVLLYDGFTNTRPNLDQTLETDYLNQFYVMNLLNEVEDGDCTTKLYLLEDDKIEPYLLYGVHIDSLDIILVSVVKQSRFIEHEKQESIDELHQIFATEGNSVYIISLDGELLYHQNEEAIGITIEDDTYPIWQSTMLMILDFAKEESSGNLQYTFYSNYANGVLKKKTAYIETIEEWDILIGASSDTDIYDDIISDFRSANYRSLAMIKIPASIVVIVLSALIMTTVVRNVDRAQRLLKEEKHLYQRLADVSSDIILICDKQGKVLFTNDRGKNVIHGKRQIEKDVYFDQILVEEDGYYILFGNQHEYFVKYSIEQIDFQNTPADLYIITDMTEQVETKQELEALSMKDELTTLYNRRMMIADYKDTILPHVKNNRIAHMVMLDLDHFKPANDKYGHHFGDEVLRKIAKIFLAHSSNLVRIYRVGGDEFALFIRDLNEVQIRKLLDTMQQQVQIYPFEKSVNLSFCAGIVPIEIGKQQQRFSDFYELADKKLYDAKALGNGNIL